MSTATETETAMWEHIKGQPNLVGMRRQADGTIVFGYNDGIVFCPAFPASMVKGLTVHWCDKNDPDYADALPLFEMNKNGVQVTYDSSADVLYVHRAGTSIHRSKETEHDCHLILNMDSHGEVVGVQLLAARETPAWLWSVHPDKKSVPTDIFDAVEDWATLPA